MFSFCCNFFEVESFYRLEWLPPRAHNSWYQKQQNNRDRRPTPRNAPMKFHQNRSTLWPVIVWNLESWPLWPTGGNTGGRGPKKHETQNSVHAAFINAGPCGFSNLKPVIRWNLKKWFFWAPGWPLGWGGGANYMGCRIMSIQLN